MWLISFKIVEQNPVSRFRFEEPIFSVPIPPPGAFAICGIEGLPLPFVNQNFGRPLCTGFIFKGAFDMKSVGFAFVAKEEPPCVIPGFVALNFFTSVQFCQSLFIRTASFA